MKELDRISSAIGDIERFFDDMSRIRICEEVSEEDLKGFYAASMVLLAVINRAIDLANEVILLYGWEEPFSYAEAFRVLERQEVIDMWEARRPGTAEELPLARISQGYRKGHTTGLRVDRVGEGVRGGCRGLGEKA